MYEGWNHRQSTLPENPQEENEKRIHFGICPQISTIDNNNRAVMIMKTCWENEHKNHTVLSCFSFIFELVAHSISFPQSFLHDAEIRDTCIP
jgi:hypothetical protein